MSFSSGTFTLVAGNPVVTGTTISSTVQNNTMNDVATGLSTAVLKDGTQVTTANVDFAKGISVATTKFTVDSANGNTVVGGTLQANTINVTPGNVTWTAVLTGGATSPTGTVQGFSNTRLVSMRFPTMTVTSTATTKTFTGMPAAIVPAVAMNGFVVTGSDNGGSDVYVRLDVNSSGLISLYPNAVGGNWTNSGQMSINAFGLTYPLT